MAEYSLWKVTFSYESPSDHVGDRERETYIVVADNKEEAQRKSFAHFSETSAYRDLPLSPELVQTTVTKIQKRKLSLPELTLEADQQEFVVIPRLSGDNSSIEYLVTERKSL